MLVRQLQQITVCLVESIGSDDRDGVDLLERILHESDTEGDVSRAQRQLRGGRNAVSQAVCVHRVGAVPLPEPNRHHLAEAALDRRPKGGVRLDPANDDRGVGIHREPVEIDAGAVWQRAKLDHLHGRPHLAANPLGHNVIRCQHVTLACFPTEVAAPLQYGPRLGAIAVYLVQQQLLPWARACEILGDLLGAPLSEGTLASLIERCAQTLQPVEEQIKQALTAVEVLHQDETGLYVNGQRQWLHVSSTDQLTHYAVHPKRGKAALDAIDILPHFAGTSVHDGWRAYFHYACQHALCVVHLLRELTYLAEEQGLTWAADLIALLLDMKAATDQARAQGLASMHPLEVADWQAQFVALVTQADATTPYAQAPPGHKGRVKQSAARNLLDRLLTEQQAVLAFLHRLEVPFDNNQAERDVRMVKVQQKVSGSFRSPAGAAAFCRIRGYVSTLRKQGLHLLGALEATLRGHPILPSFESSSSPE